MTAPLTTRRRYVNSAPQATLPVGINAAVTTFALSTGTGFPPTPFVLFLDYLGAAEEVVLVTGLSGATVTACTRGYDGSSAQSHSANAPCVHGISAASAEEASLHTSSTGAHGTASPIVGTTDAQTITNKTISSSKALATATDPGLKTQAASTGTAQQIRVVDSADSVQLFRVGRGGDVLISPNDAAAVPLVARGFTAQTANLVEVQNVGASKLWVADASGRIVHKPAAYPAYKFVPPDTTSANFLQLRDSADAADQFLLTTDGQIPSAAKIWLRGFFTDDPLRYPVDGSKFRVDQNGSVRGQDTVTRIAGPAQNAVATSAVSAETKDTGVGDVTFTAVTGRKYRVRFVCRAGAVSATATCDVTIRDGGGSSPTTGSTLVAGASSGSLVAGAAGEAQLVLDEPLIGLSAGTHTVAAFYRSTAGGTVRLAQATGQTRHLTVYDEGSL